MCKEELNCIEVRLDNGSWTIYKNFCKVRGLQYSAKDRYYAIAEARILAKQLIPSEFRIIENGIEVKVENYPS